MSAARITTEQRTAARIAGAGYLAIIVFGIFAEFIVRSRLIESSDPGATAKNILDAEALFRLSVAGDLLMLICDAVVAFALYVLLRPVSQTLALVAAGFRLVHTAVYGASVLTLLFVVELLRADYLASFDNGQLNALALVFLHAHAYGYALALIFFGVHALVLGYLVAKSAFVPRALGVLLVVAGAGYLTDSFARVVLTNYEDVQTALAFIVFLPALVAELSFALWLLVKVPNGHPSPAPSAVPSPSTA
jgi:Domain of unknown function (DUF4386)